MRFKNKTGWIHEELEKKNECLDANEFGGENPEDVEKQREENDKEINKRFDGVRKTLKNVVGDDHEEKGKPHKVEEHFKTRKELAEAMKELKDSEIKFTVNRSSKEGFRYVLEYFTTVRPKDVEPLFEKIELEEGSIEDLQRHLGNKLLPPKKDTKKNEYELYWFDTEDCKGDATFKKFPTMKAAKAWYDAHHDDADKFNMAYPDTYRDTLESLTEDEDLPDAIPEEPLVVSTDVAPEIPAEVVPDEVVQTGIYSMLSSELRDTLADIENLKSLTVTLVDEGKEDFVDDLNTIIDDRTIHVGMLQTLMEKVDAKVEDAPVEEEPIEEPVEEDLKEAVDIHIEGNDVIVSKDLEEVAVIPVDDEGEEEPKKESLNEDTSRTRDDLRQEIQAELDREGNTSDVRLKAEDCGFKIVDGKVVEDDELKRKADAVTRPDFQKHLKEEMKPWIMQQGENGEPEYIGFAKSHDDMLDKMVKSHASDSIGEETYIDELDKDTYEYIKKDLSNDEIRELDKYFKECLKEDLDLHDKVFNIFGGEMKDADVDSYIDNIRKTHNFESDDELLKYIENNKED